MQQFSVVISGFEHYDGIEVNPSYEVPRILSQQGVDGLDGVELSISTVSLPVSFSKAWPLLSRTIEETKPDIVVATGLKRAARGILLERCATNIMDSSRPDVDNTAPSLVPIAPGRPAAYWTRLPLRAILGEFTHDSIPATLSSDAGTFVCNSLFYNLLNWASAQDKVLAGFVSLPVVNEEPHPKRGLPMDQLVQACGDVVRESVKYYMRPSNESILIA